MQSPKVIARFLLAPYKSARYSTYSTIEAFDISVLGYALLGLIDLKSSSGYDLRKIFAETAMGNYSSSPGAIYPALKRLQSQKLIRGVVEDSAGLRRRRVYHSTPAGTAQLCKWLSKPIAQSDVMRGGPELMLRFSFYGTGAGSRKCRQFSRGISRSAEDLSLRPRIIRTNEWEAIAAVGPAGA